MGILSRLFGHEHLRKDVPEPKVTKTTGTGVNCKGWRINNPVLNYSIK